MDPEILQQNWEAQQWDGTQFRETVLLKPNMQKVFWKVLINQWKLEKADKNKQSKANHNKTLLAWMFACNFLQ